MLPQPRPRRGLPLALVALFASAVASLPGAAAGPLWLQTGSLTASDGASGDALGFSVALSADGTTLVAGAYRRAVGQNPAQGAVYVFVKPPGGWASVSEAARLTASDGAANDLLGRSVAVSADGTTIVAGASSKTVGGSAGRGAVYVFARPAGGWASVTEAARLVASDGMPGDNLGGSVGVSADGSTAAAGAFLRRNGPNVAQGAVYVFTKPASGWTGGTETAILTASDGAANDFLGVAVAMSGDGATVVAGAHGKLVGTNPNQGAIYVFARPASGWASGTESAVLTATDGTAGGVLGLSVAASADGSTLAAGAPSMEIGPNVFQGEAYVFVRPASGWTRGTEAASLTASDGAANDQLGSAVAVSADGATVLVGAPGKQIGGTAAQGAGYVYVKPAGRWRSATETSRLVASDGGTNDKLGTAAALSGDGSLAAAGAPGRSVGTRAGLGAACLFTGGSAAGNVWVLPSSAHSAGVNGAFFTTDLTVGNTGTADATFTLKFLGHDADGTAGPEVSYVLAAGRTATYADVLGSVFGQTAAWGAIRVSSASPTLDVLGQTSTAGFGGTFGQSVPAAAAGDLVTSGAPRSIVAIREDAAFRTNLMLANGGATPMDVQVMLVGADGRALGLTVVSLPALGMTQLSRVVRVLGVSGDISGARLLLSTTTPSAAFAAYASAIDNGTNDSRTLLPEGPASPAAAPNVWILPSSARSPGVAGAFFTTDLTVGNAGSTAAQYTIKFLGHDRDGSAGAEATFSLGPNQSVTYADVLASVFGETLNYGAISVSSASPSLVVLGQTSTAGFGGTFGQSVPAAAAADLVASGAPRSIVAVREDAAFRTNLMLANATAAPADVDVTLVLSDGTTFGPRRRTLLPFGMTQVSRVVRDLGAAGDVSGARLVLSTPTAGAFFAAYASAIDNVTNDSRTLLPR